MGTASTIESSADGALVTMFRSHTDPARLFFAVNESASCEDVDDPTSASTLLTSAEALDLASVLIERATDLAVKLDEDEAWGRAHRGLFETGPGEPMRTYSPDWDDDREAAFDRDEVDARFRAAFGADPEGFDDDPDPTQEPESTDPERRVR
jgi:hypothetical protein